MGRRGRAGSVRSVGRRVLRGGRWGRRGGVSRSLLGRRRRRGRVVIEPPSTVKNAFALGSEVIKEAARKVQTAVGASHALFTAT